MEKAITLKQARLLADKTQTECANHLHVCKQTYAKIENNPETATVAQAKSICFFLNRSIDEIFFGSYST